MDTPLKIAVVGVGRIGVYHARHIQELGQEEGNCELVAVVDRFADTAERVAARFQETQTAPIRSFRHVSELVKEGAADAAVIASRTEDHEEDARVLVDAGYRVLLEKPLTDAPESSVAFARYLAEDDRRSRALMQAFQRRFDAPLQFARELIDDGAIGTSFKAVSVLEDPLPPPAGYQSPGILPDMSVHNIDEVLWLLGKRPDAVSAFGANLHNHKISPVTEDFDDAFMQLWFSGDAIGQIQVSRNHVAGYRNETWVYGDRGVVHVGHFQEDPLEVTVDALSPAGLIQRETFRMRTCEDAPVFITRFGPAYKAEVADFVRRCLNDEPFSVTHEDGLDAVLVAYAGAESLANGAPRIPVTYPL